LQGVNKSLYQTNKQTAMTDPSSSSSVPPAVVGTALDPTKEKNADLTTGNTTTTNNSNAASPVSWRPKYGQPIGRFDKIVGVP
jgi:hypothetical protein